METRLSSRGYAVRKGALSSQEVAKLKKDLTAVPITHPDYPFAKSFPVYRIGKDFIHVPRCFGIQRFGPPKISTLKDRPFPEEKCVFKGQLRPNQLKPHDTVLSYLRKSQTGLLSILTGGGKTVCAISIISHLKQRTCVIVHSTHLLQQWCSEIARFLPDLKVGIIQQENKSFADDVDIYIVMIQTLTNIPDVPPNLFGFTIIDEAHHVPSQTFSSALFKVSSKYMLGLTATPTRKDGLTNVLHWHLGEIIYQEKPNRKDQPVTEVRIYRFWDESLQLNPRENYAGMITQIGENKTRNCYLKVILKSILDDDAEDELRRIVVFTERRGHAQLLHEIVQSLTGRSCGLILGGMKQSVVTTEKEKHIIVATYQSISEGVSIEQLNTIIFASPKKDVVQALGRIFRRVHDQIHPMIVDISDAGLRGQERTRIATYNKELNGRIDLNYYDEDLQLAESIPHKSKLVKKTTVSNEEICKLLNGPTKKSFLLDD